MLRLVIIIALAAFFVPRESAVRIAQSAYVNSVDIMTLCERRPDECRDIAEKIKQSGVVLADFSSRAAVQMQGLLENSIEHMRQFQAASPTDQGTLSKEDLTPVWRGS